MSQIQLLQHTLARPVSLAGVGLHTNRRSTVRLVPAPVGHGIRFAVMLDGRASEVAATWRERAPSRLNTALDLGGGRRLRTIEHLMASLAAFGIDNARVDVIGGEVPIFDGSARRWCAALGAAGTVEQEAPRRHIRILRPVEVRHFAGRLRVEPADALAFEISYDRLPAFGLLSWAGPITRETFEQEIAGSRSPGGLGAVWRHIVRRRAPRLASWLGGPEANLRRTEALTGADAMPADIRAAMHGSDSEPVLRGARPGRVAMLLGRHVIGGARYPGEPVRHAALDLLGDLGLAGHPILGRVVAHSPTHALTWAFCATLFRNPEAWELSPPPARS